MGFAKCNGNGSSMNKESAGQQAKITWGANPAGWTHAQNLKPGTQEFFETVLKKRFSEEMPWMDELVEFKSWSGKRVLEIGCGAGYDAYHFCKAGAEYTGIDIASENIEHTKKHLSFYGCQPRIIEMNAEQLLFKNEQFDFIFSFGVIHHIADPEKVLKNIYNQLIPGGQAELIVYYKHSIVYWVTLYFYSWWLKGERKKYNNFTERLSKIEQTGADSEPLVIVYSKAAFTGLLKTAGFTIKKVRIRKLNVEDLPAPRYLGPVFKILPRFAKRFLEYNFGWYLAVRVSK